MTRSSFSILFFIRESKVRRNGYVPIEVMITINGERSSFSTGKQVLPTDWNKAKQLVKSKNDEAKSLNNFLSALKAKLYQKEAELLDRGFIITADLLRDAYFDKVESLKEKTLFDVIVEHNAERKMMVGKTVSPATYWQFEYSTRLLKDYTQSKYKRDDLYLRELNIGFIQGFHSYLLIQRKLAQNSSAKHLKFLKKIVNVAVANTSIAYNLFNTYKIEREPVNIDFLDEEELRKIILFETPLPRLERAKDMFLFGCMTGLAINCNSL